MKKYFWLILTALTINGFAQQLPNSSFENWSLKDEYIEADGWISTNAYAYFGAPETCYPFEDAHSGQWSAKLEIRTDPITGDTVKSILILGNNYDVPGIAYTQRPTAFSFYYKNNLLDTGLFLMMLTRWNSVANQHDTVALVYNFFTTPSSTFTQVTLPISYANNNSPDSCLMYFFSSVKDKPTPGNYLIIDDLQFAGVTNTGIAEVESRKLLKVYPNPAKDKVTIDCIDEISNYNLFAVNGALLLQGQDKEVNTNLLPSGLYILQVSLKNGTVLHCTLVKQ
jgi:hypothetical protein